METVAEKTKRIIADTLGVEKERLTNETDLVKDLAADSLDIVEMAVILEKEFGVSIPDEKIERMSKVGHYIDYFETVKPMVIDNLNVKQAA